MTPSEFDRLVDDAMDVIPPRFRARIRNVAFVVESEPPRPGLLGLYEGRPLTERGWAPDMRMPDKITIYQGPHERMSHSVDGLKRLVRETIWHEVAHYFGLNERQVRLAESRRARRIDRRRR
jgi:predicted Zn-dependent protease with MMP-like domain